MRNIKITIGIPTTGQIHYMTALSLMDAVSNAPYPIHVSFQTGCYVHENRENIVKDALAVGSTHLFFVDSDMDFPSGTLDRLLALDKDIVGANYNQRSFPLVSTVKFADEKEKLYAAPIPKVPFSCFAVATGCMLIKMSVFSTIDTPWFFFDKYEGGMLGEDVWFCRQAKRKGLEVWCDPTIAVKHIGVYSY